MPDVPLPFSNDLADAVVPDERDVVARVLSLVGAAPVAG